MKPKIGIAVIALCLVCGCKPTAEETHVAIANILPTNAINVVNRGNGWSTFELDGQKYLYCKGFRSQTITVIPD